MTIDKTKLVDLLVEKTSMGKEEVEAQLDQLIERILDAAKRGKALEIKEFGVFYFDEEGELRFDASDELSTEISFKYAGMKPVELKPERDTSIPEDIEEDEDDDLEEAGETKMEEDEEEEDLFADPFEEPDIDDPEEDTESVFGIDESEEEEDSPFDFDDEDKKTQKEEEDILSDPFSDEALEPLEEPVEKEKTTNIEDIKPAASRRPVKRKDNTGIFILIAIVVIAVLIGAYFFYISPQPQSSVESSKPTSTQVDPGMSGSEDTGSGESDLTNAQTDGQQTAQDQETSSMEQAVANQGTEEEAAASDNAIPASQTDQDLYGLMGSVIEQANNGYSIVVHSFRNEQNAREAANQLRTDGGYRVIVNSRTVYDNQVWRVSVGQFETLGDAQQATTRLPDPYSTQNFIQRIRTN